MRGDFAAEDLGEDVVVVISGRAGHHESPRFSQRRASFQTRKGRCRTLNCCIVLSLNRFRFKEYASLIG
ncbi:hypothetical protein EHI47_03920 [Rhizobium leguminosarum]|uniref:Uncharacterized protein n=2 Tax=Rhizobium TaxID=379 RepID=A0A444IA35_RHILE|nr:hypothetical protein [Rhizobium leguminosarum bv. viciae]RWX03049.1 hypothetical protein EHI45_34695 [Rhizobium leguminosarum]TBE70804.1 hypothetical protein ELH03_08600 [Rhizobium beringeri]RWX35825.1 hypothetical protein EHI47_03920 [Rhizobium leguminosarum]TAU52908.1 hypothetical protein ELI43_08880 [Rhizobium leguminosarum]